MANTIAPVGPLFPSPQPSPLAAALAVALKITAIIALTVLMLLAILFYVEFSQNDSREATTPAQAPTYFDGTQNTGSNSKSLPATQSGSSGNVYNEPAAEPTTDPQAYPAPNNQTAP